MSLRVAGLDLSLNSTGYYIVGDEVRSGLVRPGTRRATQRLDFVLNAIARHVTAVGGVDLAVIEGYAMGPSKQRQRGKFDSAELGGCVRLYLYRERIPMLIVPPKSLKLFAVGNGNAGKEQMVEAARLAGYVCQRHDDADAYFLYLMGCAYLTGRIRCANRKRGMAGSEYFPVP